MKIILINTLYWPNLVGGAERSVKVLADTFLRMGHEPVVVTLNPPNESKVESIDGVKVYYVELKNFYWPHDSRERGPVKKLAWHMLDRCNWIMARKIGEIVRSEGPDIVHTNNLVGFSTYIWSYIRHLNIPIVHTLRDYSLLCSRTTMCNQDGSCLNRRCISCKILKSNNQYRTNSVDAVVGISRYVLERHLSNSLFSTVNVKKVIPNSYRAENIGGSITSNIVRFGYLGRLDPSKGIELLLSVLGQLSFGGWSGIVAGKGERGYEEYLRREFRSSNIRFVGQVQPSKFFSEIDLLIVPSIWEEPFGRVIIEAFAHGIPVIGSRRGGIPELVTDGKTGFLFDPNDPKQLRQLLLQITRDRRKLTDMSKQCLQSANMFLPDVVADQYLMLYRNLIDNNHSRRSLNVLT